jgi:hypothetical protein
LALPFTQCKTLPEKFHTVLRLLKISVRIYSMPDVVEWLSPKEPLVSSMDATRALT